MQSVLFHFDRHCIVTRYFHQLKIETPWTVNAERFSCREGVDVLVVVTERLYVRVGCPYFGEVALILIHVIHKFCWKLEYCTSLEHIEGLDGWQVVAE